MKKRKGKTEKEEGPEYKNCQPLCLLFQKDQDGFDLDLKCRKGTEAETGRGIRW